MTQAVAKLIEDIKSLSSDEYADFLDELSFMGATEVHGDVEREQLTEVQRRIAEVESGAVKLIPGDEVFAGIDRLLTELREGKR